MVKFIGLKMQGIRSISDTPQCINFLTPLTIIQGPNGTGKTTIIEALNYVTTGALPAGKMQTFIHNTQLSNRSRVDALVQLVFVDIRGNKCIATKRMNASASNRGQGKLTTKSDEFTLRIEDKFGNPKSISSKVVDFNKEMLNLLGVPKAVLEYVLFCHQEESNWPLSEPKELKMRFDAIFEVTKYVKALETVKKNIKELHVQIQGVDKELPHLENNLRANADLRLKYHDASTALKHNKKTIEQLGTEKEAHDRELMATRRQVELAVKANNEFEILQGQINTHRRLIDSMPAAEYPGTLEQLKQAIETLKFSSAIIEAEEQRASITRQLHTITYEIDRCKKAEEACRTTMMHHMARQEAMQNREAEYLTLLQQCASKFDITVDPNFVDSLENKLKLIEEEMQKFKQTEMDRIRGLGDSIEKARTKFAELKSSSQSRRQECAKLSQSISQAEREVKSSGNTSQVVDKLTQDIAKLEVQLKSLSDFKLLDTVWESLSDLQLELNALKMDMIELGDNDSVEHVRDKATSLLDKAGENLNATMANVDMLKKRVKIINQLAEFKDRKAAANERLVQLETLKLSIQEKSEQIKELEQLMTTAGRELPNVEKELRTLEQAKEKLVASMHQRERDFFNQMDSIRAAIQKIEQMKTAITRDKESASVPSDISEKLEQQKSQIERLLAEKSQLEKKMDGADVHKHELRVMEEQLRRMELERDLEKLRLQLEEKKENAALTGVEDLADLRKKEQRVNHNCVETNNQIHQRNGEQLQMKKRLADLKQQLEERRYADAKQLYMDKLVERSITTAAIEDLEKYYKIVDNAIINFHQQKMEQINQILRELWTRVYQGNDIETIKIKSQPVSGGEKKKSYDYSVVMTVDQTDIDMRDRCSAGQKVLASILIRIALADVFAGSCRILALDEPTTNLDADKVENIGTMLKNLIEIQTLPDDGNGAIGAAQLHATDEADLDGAISVGEGIADQQGAAAAAENNSSPLQLIVITHDRRLVEHLHLACRPDYIYGLSKDENGVSRIKKHENVSAADQSGFYT